MNTMTSPLDDPYREIAELYDLEHSGFDEDTETLVNFAQAIGGPVLEAGCGSGRLLLPLAEAGLHVTGIDTSEPMLDRARRLIARHDIGDRVTLVDADMRAMDEAPGGPFELVIFSLNSLMHLETQRDQRAALDAARRALAPTGQIIIDLMNPTMDQVSYLLEGVHFEGTWTLEDGSIIDKWSHREASGRPQVLDTLIWYDRTFPDGRLTRTRTAFPLRYIHAPELALMLELAGFVDSLFYGSYDLDPYDPESERLLVTARVDATSSGHD